SWAVPTSSRASRRREPTASRVAEGGTKPISRRFSRNTDRSASFRQPASPRTNGLRARCVAFHGIASQTHEKGYDHEMAHSSVSSKCPNRIKSPVATLAPGNARGSLCARQLFRCQSHGKQRQPCACE